MNSLESVIKYIQYPNNRFKGKPLKTIANKHSNRLKVIIFTLSGILNDLFFPKKKLLSFHHAFARKVNKHQLMKNNFLPSLVSFRLWRMFVH